MSKLYHLYKGMPCCGHRAILAKPVIEVVGESTLEQEAPFDLFRCGYCISPIPSTEPLLITVDGSKYLKSLYKPFDNGVVDEVQRETSERSERVQQVPSNLGHERPRTTAMQSGT